MRRDVVLREADGTVAFAARSVEAPVGWSDVAVATVARRWMLQGRAPERSSCRRSKGVAMSVAKVIEISATSPGSFEAAVKAGIAKAGETVRDIRGVWVKERVEDGEVVEFRVDLKVTFVLE